MSDSQKNDHNDELESLCQEFKALAFQDLARMAVVSSLSFATRKHHKEQKQEARE